MTDRAPSDEEAVRWLAATRFHDWSDGALPRAMLGSARELGLIGPAEWVQEDVLAPPRALDRPLDPFDLLAPAVARPEEEGPIVAGGSDPHPWKAHLSFSPFDPDRGRVRVASVVAIDVLRAAVPSAALADAFRRVHRAENTEFAGVHPLARWEALRAGPYRPAVTTSPTFAGVLWLTFLGPGHLDQFDPLLLQDLDAHRVEWIADRGLLLQAVPTLDEADTPDAEARMLRLTERFRAALRP